MFNPGQFLQDSRQFYHPETTEDDRMFKKPIVRANTNIWNPQNKVLFSLKEPLGKNKVKKSDNKQHFVIVIEIGW